MLYCFDLDGTLIDSREVLIEAYRSVGVEPPSDFFVKSWREWLPDPELHRKKNEIYLKIIHKIRPLPLMQLYHSLEGHAMIMTAASRAAVKAVARQFQLDSSTIMCEMSVSTKIHTMNLIPNPGIMFEDQKEPAERMRKETKWT